MIDPNSIYHQLIAAAEENPAIIQHFQLGLTWSSCTVTGAKGVSMGFAMSPGEKSRVLQWPGTVAGTAVKALSDKLMSWHNFDATLALAACNAAINSSENHLLQNAKPVATRLHGNLAVFDYFRPRLNGKKVVVVGRYPNLDTVLAGLDVTVLERAPEGSDLPDPAAEFVIPRADWVFLTATSLINKTFTRMCELARDCVTVLMGPSTPWLPQLSEWHVDFIAGVKVVDAAKATQIVAEGGGTRLFEGGVEYALAYIGGAREQQLKSRIADMYAARERLKHDMDAWYSAGNQKRFPEYAKLNLVENELAKLDSAFKRLWDATH